MSWAVGWDEHWQRDIGYGVPAICDHPGCGVSINRGLSYVCGAKPYGGEDGCGLFFCYTHLTGAQFCARCSSGGEPFEPTPEVPEWIHHKLTDPSWAKWRQSVSTEVEVMG